MSSGEQHALPTESGFSSVWRVTFPSVSAEASPNGISSKCEPFYLGWPMPQTKPAKPLPSSGPQREPSTNRGRCVAVGPIRQLDRQIQSQFYERTALARDKAAVLRGGTRSLATDTVTPDEEIKNPYLLEFLGLKDE